NHDSTHLGKFEISEKLKGSCGYFSALECRVSSCQFTSLTITRFWVLDRLIIPLDFPFAIAIKLRGWKKIERNKAWMAVISSKLLSPGGSLVLVQISMSFGPTVVAKRLVDTMRAPSLLAQCLPGLVPQDKGSQSTPSISERDVHLPSPATAHPYKYAGENVDLQGLNVFKGRVSVADIIGFNGSESISSKPEGYLKSWDSSIDLVNVLKHEIRDGQLSFRGKRVLELGCSYGLPGVFACLKSRQAESPLTPSRHSLSPSVHFYAGDWEELPTVLSVVRGDGFEGPTGMSLSFSEEDFMDGCSSQDGSIIGHESSSRRSRKLSGSRAWERASESDQGEGGYDVILMAEIPYSLNSLKKLYSLIKKCVRPPYGVLYLATKKNYVGFNSGARHLRSLVDEEGVFGAHLVKEMTDRDIWKFFLK
ncbi:hypothetical protein SDJN02_10274, partial [Cucurbita argyrosperma subsp. argyrosperma]